MTPSLTSSSNVVLLSRVPLWWLDAASRLSSSRLAERVSVSLKSRVSIWITCTQRLTVISYISFCYFLFLINRPLVGAEKQILYVVVHQISDLWLMEWFLRKDEATLHKFTHSLSDLSPSARPASPHDSHVQYHTQLIPSVMILTALIVLDLLHHMTHLFHQIHSLIGFLSDDPSRSARPVSLYDSPVPPHTQPCTSPPC